MASHCDDGHKTLRATLCKCIFCRVCLCVVGKMNNICHRPPDLKMKDG